VRRIEFSYDPEDEDKLHPLVFVACTKKGLIKGVYSDCVEAEKQIDVTQGEFVEEWPLNW
jgi:hypothetical protein